MLSHRTEIELPRTGGMSSAPGREAKKIRWWHYGCSVYLLASVVGMLLCGGGCFTSLRALNSISGGDGRPTIASLTLDVLTFPLQAVVFGPAYLEHSIRNQEYLSELSSFSNKCDQTHAEIRTNSEAFVAIGLGCTRYGCRSLKALTDASKTASGGGCSSSISPPTLISGSGRQPNFTMKVLGQPVSDVESERGASLNMSLDCKDRSLK